MPPSTKPRKPKPPAPVRPAPRLAPDYPVTFHVAYPESSGRWLILARWLLAVPHYVVLCFLSLIVGLASCAAFFTILFAKTYPDELYRVVVGVHRWGANVAAYVLFLDRYPPFSMSAGRYDAVTLTVEQSEYSRWLVLGKWLLVLPHLFILSVLSVVAIVATGILVFGVLFTGRYPRGLFEFIVGVARWHTRVNAYASLLVDRYPPFSLR